MTISATIIADSISPAGIRITTMQLRYPRFIHAEFMTHRVFSRNASSSRAIPVQKMIEDLRRDYAMPVYWGSNKPGMQAGAELSEDEIEEAENYWINAMETAIDYANNLVDLGLHKQIANRILEPWAHINVVVTATDWQNFFDLRRHKDAQPEIHELADRMYEAREASSPKLLEPGEWHLPFADRGEDYSQAKGHITGGGVLRVEPTFEQIYEVLVKVSVARCARVSYLTHDGRKTSVEEDLALCEKLVGSVPLHASPAEHQATPDPKGVIDTGNSSLWGNFTGWIQFRKTIENV